MRDTCVMENAILGFILSREAKMCRPRTIKWYSYHLGRIKKWLNEREIYYPEQINSRLIGLFILDLKSNGYSSSYIHGYARIIRTFTKFLFKNGYITEEIDFDMPILTKTRQRVYSIEEIKKILKICVKNRDKAFVLFMIDSGVRLGEVLKLNWGDINLRNGIVRIDDGKGGKFRTVVVSPKTRQAVVKYKSEVDSSDSEPVFQTNRGTRFTESGLRSWMNRLSKNAGIHITPHALRRSFATLSVKSGMDLFRLQALMGHSSLEMTKEYVRTLDEDLLDAHQKHSPVNLILNH